jgi:hypothetical protein
MRANAGLGRSAAAFGNLHDARGNVGRALLRRIGGDADHHEELLAVHGHRSDIDLLRDRRRLVGGLLGRLRDRY